MASPSTTFKFTKTALLTIEPTTKRVWYRDTQTPGLALCVTPAGTKTFYVVRRVAGMGRKGNTEYLRLAAFPDMTVEQARTDARDNLKSLNSGESVRTAKRTRKDELTVGDLWEAWINERALGPVPDKPIKRSWKKDQRLYDNHLKSRARRKVGEITPTVANKIFRDVTVLSGPVEANHVKRLARAMWNHMIKQHSAVIGNPWTAVKSNHETHREAWVKPSQMPALFKAIDSLSNQDAADFIKLCLFTGARSGNVKGMRWEQLELDSGTWTISSSHHKNKRIHTVPLPPPAIGILKARRGVSKEWVFPSSTSSTGHITDIRESWKQTVSAFARELGMDKAPDFRIHDLRHTTASWLVGQGVSLPMVGKLLGHAAQATTARYAHLATDPVREALNRATAAMEAVPKEQERP